MDEIKRYNMDWIYSDWEENKIGEWVKYEDHLKAIEELKTGLEKAEEEDVNRG